MKWLQLSPYLFACIPSPCNDRDTAHFEDYKEQSVIVLYDCMARPGVIHFMMVDEDLMGLLFSSLNAVIFFEIS
jgi:hypothetical protein